MEIVPQFLMLFAPFVLLFIVLYLLTNHTSAVLSAVKTILLIGLGSIGVLLLLIGGATLMNKQNDVLPKNEVQQLVDTPYEQEFLDSKMEFAQDRLCDDCFDRYYCGNMPDCSFAYDCLNSCGLSRLDADSDGVPCESICR